MTMRLHANAKDNVHYTYIQIQYIFPLARRSEKFGYFINLGEMNNLYLLRVTKVICPHRTIKFCNVVFPVTLHTTSKYGLCKTFTGE
jgi:hypothetical protein